MTAELSSTSVTLRPLSATEQSALAGLLGQAPAANLFQLSRLHEYGLGSRRRDQPAFSVWGVQQDGQLIAEVSMFNGAVALYCADPAALPLLAAQVRQLRPEGVSGIHAQVDSLLAALGPGACLSRDDCTFCWLDSPAHANIAVPNPTLPTPRRALLADIEPLIDFYQHGFYTLTHLPSRDLWRQRLLDQLLKRDTFIMVERGRVMAAAQRSAETADHAMLGGVATLPMQRGRGYAAAGVGALCAHLFDKGKRRVCLFYLATNQPAAHLYQRLGFTAGDQWVIARLGL
jgi:ribosomal protein S18 acetylase RimI-like enzyme